MTEAAASYLPESGMAGIICLAVAFVGLIVSLMGLTRPRTNTACVAALLIFFIAWMIECSSHLLVTYAQLPAEWRMRGLMAAGVLFAAGLVTGVIGLIGLSRNEHRYDHGFLPGLIAVLGNGWVVAAAITAVVNGQWQKLGRGMVFPVLSSTDSLNLPANANDRRSDPGDLRAYQELMDALVARMLSITHAEDPAAWREVPLADAQFVTAIDPEANRLFSSPSGPSWMALFVRKEERMTPETLQDHAEKGLQRALASGLSTQITWRERVIVDGFDACRAGYVASLPSLPGPHVFDRWLASGHGWRLSIVQWTPSSAAARDFRRHSDSLARMLLTSAVLQLSPKSQRSEDIYALLTKAAESSQKNDLPAALAAYQNAAGLAPDDAEIVLMATSTMERLKHHAAALQFVEERRARFPASPALDATRWRLLTATSPADQGLLPEFDRLLTAGLRDDATFATALALLDARRDTPTALAILDKWGATHAKAVSDAWQHHFNQPATAQPPAASPNKVANPVAPAPEGDRAPNR